MGKKQIVEFENIVDFEGLVGKKQIVEFEDLVGKKQVVEFEGLVGKQDCEVVCGQWHDTFAVFVVVGEVAEFFHRFVIGV